MDPGDEVIKAAAERTGLALSAQPPERFGIAGYEVVVVVRWTKAARGFDTLVDQQTIDLVVGWATASMDQQTADRCMLALREELKPEHTLVLSDHHNLQLLNFVDRLIVVANNRIVLDGPKDEVIARLKGAQPNAARTNPPIDAP